MYPFSEIDFDSTLAARGQALAIAFRAHYPVTTPRLLSGREVLRWAARVTGTDPHEALALIGSQMVRLADVGDISEASLYTLRGLVGQYHDYLAAAFPGLQFGAVTSAHARAFVQAPYRDRNGAVSAPSIATKHHRRTAIRLSHRIGRSLGLCETDPTLDLVLPPRSRGTQRPLSDDEMILGRSFARGFDSPRHLVAWTLAEAGAALSEIPAVGWDALDLEAGLVHLPGTPRLGARVNPLTPFGSAVLTQMDADEPTTLDAPTRSRSASAAAGNALREILKRAGLGLEPDVVPSSIRAWRGAAEFAAHRDIIRVASVLGTGSLDTAARVIHLTWQGGA